MSGRREIFNSVSSEISPQQSWTMAFGRNDNMKKVEMIKSFAKE